MKLIPLAPIYRVRRLIVAPKLWWLATAFMAVALSSASATTTGSFTLVGSMSQFRRQHTATLLLNGKVLVAGGAPFLPAATSEIYDPVNTTWTNSGRLNFGRELHTATLLTSGVVLVAGGFPDIASTEIFDPASGQWEERFPMNAPRCQHTATLLPDGQVLVPAGLASTMCWPARRFTIRRPNSGPRRNPCTFRA